MSHSRDQSQIGFYIHHLTPKEWPHFFVCCQMVSYILLNIKVSLECNEVNQKINFQKRLINFNGPNIFRKFVANLSFQCAIFRRIWLKFSLPLNRSALLFIVTSLTSRIFIDFIFVWVSGFVINNVTLVIWS